MGYQTEWRTETREVRRKVTTGCTCDNCGAEMQPMWPDAPDPWECGAKNALPLTLHGYYGGYFDCDEDPQSVICQECANKLVAAFPFAHKAIDSTLPF